MQPDLAEELVRAAASGDWERIGMRLGNSVWDGCAIDEENWATTCAIIEVLNNPEPDPSYDDLPDELHMDTSPREGMLEYLSEELGREI